MERHEAGLAPGEDALGKDRSCRGPPACCSTVPGVLGVLSPTLRWARGVGRGGMAVAGEWGPGVVDWGPGPGMGVLG